MTLKISKGDHQLFLSAGEVVITLIKSYEANYPEILKCCYIINGNSAQLFSVSNKIIIYYK